MVPFLQPRHFPPIPSFYDEWLGLTLGLTAIGLAALVPRRTSVQVPALALWLAAFALFVAMRALGTAQAYVQSLVLWAGYAFFAALLVVLGAGLATWFGRERACDTLALCVLAGALANTAAGMLQVAGIPGEMDAFVAYLSGPRAMGNVGQPNLFANYLALGQASLAYLFARGRLRPAAMLAAALLLTAGAALAASRSSLLYAAGFALLGTLAWWRSRTGAAARFGASALALAILGVLMHWVVPAARLALGLFPEGVDPDPDRGASFQNRLLAWGMAWRLFLASPWLGVGPGEFAGAAFERGLDPRMAAEGAWRSPHNLLLQLLSETGLPGAVLVVGGLLLWLRHAGRDVWRAPDAAMCWVAACAGIEMVHALVEYPLSYAHYLAVTALVMGVGAAGRGVPTRLPFRPLLASSALAGAVLAGSVLGDYLRYDLANPLSAGRSVAPETRIARDQAALRGLSNGLLAASTEYWLYLALPLNADGLHEKMALGERVMRVWPLQHVAARHSAYLALAGREVEARALSAHTHRTFSLSPATPAPARPRAAPDSQAAPPHRPVAAAPHPGP